MASFQIWSWSTRVYLKAVSAHQLCSTSSSIGFFKVLDKYKNVAVSPSFSITDLEYFDDVDMLTESVAEAQATINGLGDKALSTGLQISVPKTKTMQTAGMYKTPTTLNGSQIEDVQSQASWLNGKPYWQISRSDPEPHIVSLECLPSTTEGSLEVE